MTLTPGDAEKINELIRLHDEAFNHYRKTGGDGWKSSEGYVEVRTGTIFDRDGGDDSIAIGFYSYVFGPGRMKNFATIDEALAAMREWHAEEMATTAAAREAGEGW